MTPPSVHVGLVENDRAYRQEIETALAELPEIAAVSAWDSAEAFWRDPAGGALGLLLLDIKLGGMSGVELAAKVTARNPETAIVMLSNLNSDDLVFQALRNGAVGYLWKSELRDVGATERTVLAGGATITPTIALQVLTSFRRANPLLGVGLTDREKQILELMVSGKTIARVADILHCSPHTVHDHARKIYRKLNVHNRSELVQKAAAGGIIPKT